MLSPLRSFSAKIAYAVQPPMIACLQSAGRSSHTPTSLGQYAYYAIKESAHTYAKILTAKFWPKPFSDLDGFDNILGTKNINGDLQAVIKYGDSNTVTELNDLSLGSVASKDNAPFDIQLKDSTGNPIPFGIYKIIIYAKDSETSIAGWEVNLTCYCYVPICCATSVIIFGGAANKIK